MSTYLRISTSIGAALVGCFVWVGGASAQDCSSDSTPPTLTCGPPTTVFTDASGQAAIPNLAASVPASDNCTASGSLVRTQSPAAGTLVGVGAHPILVTVMDAAKNSNTCLTTFTAQAQVPATPVLIVNTLSEPVATTIQGTASVRVDGTPSVNVANTVPVTLISSPFAEPLRTCNTCEPPVQAQIDIVQEPGSGPFVLEELFIVPPGTRLVIEFITLNVRLPSLLQGLDFASFITVVNGVSVRHDLDVRRISLESPRFVASQQVRIYADAGTNVRCGFFRTSSSGTASGDCSMSGYLVTMP